LEETLIKQFESSQKKLKRPKRKRGNEFGFRERERGERVCGMVRLNGGKCGGVGFGEERM